MGALVPPPPITDGLKKPMSNRVKNPPGRAPGKTGAKTRPQGQLECANPRGRSGRWSGLELTDTLKFRKYTKFGGNWLKNKKGTVKKQNSEWITPPSPSVLIGLR